VKRSRRLDTLVRLAAMAERNARTGLARATQDLMRKDGQQRQLESYETEYGEAWLDAGRRGLPGDRAKGLAAFRDSLANTLEAQRSSVRLATSQRDEQAHRWQGMRAQLRVFEDLAKRSRQDEERERERKLQKAIDELSTRVRTID
jgi:flagellar export protein FliJ